MVPKNLVHFFEKLVPNAPSGADAIYKFFDNKNRPSTEGVEADLDVQYIMGVAPGIATEFWEQKGDDFCKDLMNWTSSLQTADPADVPLVNSVSYVTQFVP
jgi:hypothetical protein